MFYKLVVWTFLLINSVSAIYASEDIFDLGKLYFEKIGDTESLPQCCTVLTQDKSGFIWIGTQSGLVRYDGYRFRHFRHSPQNPESISDNFIRSLSVAADGKIWVGTAANGLSIYNPVTEKFKNYRHQQDDAGSLSHDRVNAIVFDKQGGAWIGTQNGLDYLDPATQKFTRYRHQLSNSEITPDLSERNVINSLLIDDQDTLWIGTAKGLNLLKAESFHFENFYRTSDSQTSVIEQNIRSIFQSQDRKIWVGTHNHGIAWVDLIDNSQQRPTTDSELSKQLSRSLITSFEQTSSGEIWVSTFGNGIFIIEPEKGIILRQVLHSSALPSSISLNNIGGLLKDSSGLIWVATWGGGLNRFNPHNKAFLTLRHSANKNSTLSYADIGAILKLKNGQFWIGSHGNGIDIIDPALGLIDSIRPDIEQAGALGGGIITSIVQTPDSTIWVGTQRAGLHRYIAESKSFLRYTKTDGLGSNYIRFLQQDKDGGLWVSTDNALSKFDPISQTFVKFSAFNNSKKLLLGKTITSLAFQKNGDAWIGTLEGLYLLSSSKDKLIKFTTDKNNPSSLSSSSVAGLLIDSKNRLWVDTMQGLDKLVSQNGNKAVFKSMSSLVGSPGLYLGGNLLEDKLGRIWTQWYMLDPKTLSLHKLSRAEGVDIGTAWIGAFTKTDNGVFLFGGTEGVLMVKPELFKPWELEPEILISELKIDGKNQQEANLKELLLSPSVKNFSIEFSLQDFSAPEKNRFAYRLDGYDTDWVETDAEHRIANYTNLDPGNYVFRLKGSTRNKTWSNFEFSLSITQLAAWYQTIWFKLLVSLFALFLVYLIIKIRLQRLKHQKLELQVKVDERTKELEQALSDLEKISLTDPLTGTHNRRFLNQFIDQDLVKLQRDNKESHIDSHSSFGFILVDIDDFKAVNDEFGHDAGDKVLMQIADTLSSSCRKSDWIIRWGGEEFLIVGRFTKRNKLQKQAERIRNNIENKTFELGNNQQIKQTCSIGISTFPFIKNDPDALTWEQTLKLADLALYTAKNNDKNIWISLFEKNISNPSHLFNSVQNDLASQINDGIIDFETSRDNINLKF